MPVMIGTSALADVRVGASQVSRVMVGTVQVWPTAPPVGDPLLESRWMGMLVEAAYLPPVGQQQSVLVLVEAAVAGSLSGTLPDGLHMAMVRAEVLTSLSSGVREVATVRAEVLGQDRAGDRVVATIILEVLGT